jgi:hypothetical protein
MISVNQHYRTVAAMSQVQGEGSFAGPGGALKVDGESCIQISQCPADDFIQVLGNHKIFFNPEGWCRLRDLPGHGITSF